MEHALNDKMNIMPEDALDRIEEIRNEIDKIDEVILEEVAKRQKLGAKLYPYKSALGLPISDPSRDVLKLVAAKNGGEDGEDISLAQAAVQRSMLRNNSFMQYRQAYKEDTSWNKGQDIQRGIKLAKSKNAREEARVIACLATASGNYNDAVHRLFPNAAVVPVRSVSAALSQLEDGAVHLTILPVNNLAVGGIVELARKVREKGFYIAGDISFPLYHRLLALPETKLGNIRKVIGSASALELSSKLIKNMGWQTEEVSHEKVATRQVAEMKNPNVAALASVDTGDMYNLQVIETETMPMRVSQTRFIAIAREPWISEDSNTVSVMMRLSHQSGALSEALEIFADRGINLRHVYSMNVEEKIWEYEIYLEIEARPNDTQLMGVLYGLDHQENRDLAFLGWYQSIVVPD